MKKRKLTSLVLRKKSIANFKPEISKGGRRDSYMESCMTGVCFSINEVTLCCEMQ